MTSNSRKIYIIKFLTILFFVNFGPAAMSQETDREFSEIKFHETTDSTYFLDAINNDKIRLEKDPFNKNSLNINVDNKAGLTGSVKVNTYEEDDIFYDKFYIPTKQNLNVRAEFSQDLNSFLDFNTGLSVQSSSNRVEKMPDISNLNVSTDIVPHHKIYVGQTRVYDESSPSLELFNTVESRYGLKSFEEAGDIDLKLSKENGLINYSAGAYNLNKSRTEQALNQETSVAGGYASLNPFNYLSGPGELQFGGGYFTNKHTAKGRLNQENIYSVFTGYKFSRFIVRGEFLREDNGLRENQTSDSWHLSNRIAVTDNLNLKTGFKQYEETSSTESNVGFEYSFKDSPVLKNENLQIKFDASFRKGEEWGNNDSERFGIKTKYLF